MLPFGTVTGTFLGMKLSCFKWIHYLQTSFFLKKHLAIAKHDISDVHIEYAQGSEHYYEPSRHPHELN